MCEGNSVSEVLSISEEDLSDPPKLSVGFNNSYIKQIGKAENEIKLIIDCEKLLSEDEMETIKVAV